MRSTTFFKLYKICILSHRCNLKIFSKNRFEKSAFSLKIQQNFANVAEFAKFAKFQKIQLHNLVDFEKCCKTHIYLQKSVPIQPKTSNILPKFCQKLATTLRVAGDASGPSRCSPSTRARTRAPSRTRRVSANFWQIFGKLSLVFGCIKTKFCKKICV